MYIGWIKAGEQSNVAPRLAHIGITVNFGVWATDGKEFAQEIDVAEAQATHVRCLFPTNGANCSTALKAEVLEIAIDWTASCISGGLTASLAWTNRGGTQTYDRC